MPVTTQWYQHAALFPDAYTWSLVAWVVPATSTREGPTLTIAALTNPNRELYPTQDPSVGHVLYCLLYVTGGSANTIQWQFRVPTGSGTWHTMHTSSPVAGYITINTVLEALFIPPVPQFRPFVTNGGGTDATWEGAVTLYTM